MRTAAAERTAIVVVGARLDGQAGVVLDVLEALGDYHVVGFLDNSPGLRDAEVAGVPVLGSTDDLAHVDLGAARAHVAIGDNVARGRLFRLLEDRGVIVETLIHPLAHVSPTATIGRGCFIGAGALIQPGTRVGDACLINSGVILEHDNRVGFAAHLAPGSRTGGRVIVGDYSFLGLGSTTLPDIEIGSGVLVGAGSTVVKNVPSNTTVMGYAARARNTKKNIYEQATPDVDTLAHDRVYVARPTLPDYPLVERAFSDIHECGMLSNFARFNGLLEREVERRLSVPSALTLPNATSALMLLLRVLDLKGEVILPSFTFSATGHALLWNSLVPVFADIDLRTFTLDPVDVERKITRRTAAIVGVHTFGNPCDVASLARIAREHSLPLVFDAAHALGSSLDGQMVGGFGQAEVFSLSGTKVVTAGEGGILTTSDGELVDRLRLGRNYGAGADYDCRLLGLNGKMSEFHAALALESLAVLDDYVAARNRIARRYVEQLSGLPGLTFQSIPAGHVSTYKDFAVLVDPRGFGLDRDGLIERLEGEGIFCKRYFHPPLHRMQLYRGTAHRAEGLEVTESIARRVLCLPIYSHMDDATIDRIVSAIHRHWRGEGRRVVSQPGLTRELPALHGR